MIKIILRRNFEIDENDSLVGNEELFLNRIEPKSFLKKYQTIVDLEKWELKNIIELIEVIKFNSTDDIFEINLFYNFWNRNILFLYKELNLFIFEDEFDKKLLEFQKIFIKQKDINKIINSFKELSEKQKTIFLINFTKNLEELSILSKLNLSINSKILSKDNFLKYYLINQFIK